MQSRSSHSCEASRRLIASSRSSADGGHSCFVKSLLRAHKRFANLVCKKVLYNGLSNNSDFDAEFTADNSKLGADPSATEPNDKMPLPSVGTKLSVNAFNRAKSGANGRMTSKRVSSNISLTTIRTNKCDGVGFDAFVAPVHAGTSSRCSTKKRNQNSTVLWSNGSVLTHLFLATASLTCLTIV